MSDSSAKNASLIDEKNTFVRFGTPQSSSQELNYTKSNSMPADMFCKLMGENYTSVLRDASVTARHHASEASAIEVSGDAPELTHYIQNETEALFSKPRRCSSGFGSRTPKSVRFSSNIVHFKVASPHSSTTHAGTTAARCADDDVPMPVHADREGDIAYIAGTNPNPDDDFNPLVVMTRGSLSDLQSVCADNESVRRASSLRLRVPRKNLSINTEDCESVMHGYPDTPDASSGVDFRMRPSATSETSSVPQNRLDWCGAPSTPSTFKTMDSFSREPWSSNVPYERQHLPGERHAELYHDSAAANAYVAHLHRLLSPKRPPPVVLPDDQCMHVLKSHVVPFQGYQHVYAPHQAVENHHFDEHNYGDQNYYGRNYETYQYSSHHYSSGLSAQEHAFDNQMPYVPKVRRGDRPVEVVSATEGTRTNVISLEHTLPDAMRCAKTQCSLQKKSSRHDLEDPPPTRTDTGPTKKTLGDKSLDARPATWSLGSELHHKRECKPCLFYHTNRGCHESADCSFCHYCPAGEVQHRRKEKTAELRLQEKRLRRQEERKNRKYKRRLAKERSRNYKQNECHDAELSDTSTKESTDYVGVSGERTIATFSGDCLSFCAAHPAFTREVGRLGKGARGGGKSFQGKAVYGHPQAPKGEGKVGKSSGAQQLEFATV